MASTSTTTANGTSEQALDRAIERIETLYRTVTGRDVPPLGERESGAIPPERDPEQHVGDQIDRLVDALGRVGAPRPAAWAPPLTVWESAEELRIQLDLPGVRREEARVTATRGWLEVSGRRDPRVPDDDDTHHQLRHAEPWQGLFRRTLPIPPDAEVDRLEAQMIDGVLDIRVPRRQTARQGRDVPVS